MMTKRNKVSAILLGAILALGVGVGLNASKIEPVRAAEETITLNSIGANTSDSDSVKQTTVNGYVLNYKKGKPQEDGQDYAMLLTKSAGAFVGNKTPIPGHIKSVKLDIASTASDKTSYYVHFSSSEFAAAGSGGSAVVIKKSSSHTFNNTNTSGDLYFAVSLGNANNGQVMKIEIKYESGGGGGTVDPDPEFGNLYSILIKTPATKLSFQVGETFSAAGLVLTAIDDSDPVVKKEVTSGFTTNFDGITFNGAHIGTKEVEITYEENGAEAYENYDIVISEAVFTSTTTYGGGSNVANLVTDVANLAIGDKILISGTKSTETHVMSTTQSDNNRPSVVATKSGNQITGVDASTMQIITLEAGTKPNTFAFNVGSGYLYAASSEKNYLRTQTNKDDNASFIITISGTTATAIAQGSNSRNSIRFNSGNTPPLFSCYSTGQDAIEIYEVDLSAGGYNYDYLLDVLKGAYCEFDVAGLDLIISRYQAMTSIEKAHFNSAYFVGNNGVGYTGEVAYIDVLVRRATLGGQTTNKNPFTAAFEQNEIVMILVVVSLIGVSAIAGSLFIFKKKKK